MREKKAESVKARARDRIARGINSRGLRSRPMRHLLGAPQSLLGLLNLLEDKQASLLGKSTSPSAVIPLPRDSVIQAD